MGMNPIPGTYSTQSHPTKKVLREIEFLLESGHWTGPNIKYIHDIEEEEHSPRRLFQIRL